MSNTEDDITAIKQALKLIMLVDMRGEGSNLLEEAEAILTARLTPEQLLEVEFDAQHDYAGEYLPKPVAAITRDNQAHLGLGNSQPSASLHDPHGVISSPRYSVPSWLLLGAAGLAVAAGIVRCTIDPVRRAPGPPITGAATPAPAAAEASPEPTDTGAAAR